MTPTLSSSMTFGKYLCVERERMEFSQDALAEMRGTASHPHLLYREGAAQPPAWDARRTRVCVRARVRRAGQALVGDALVPDTLKAVLTDRVRSAWWLTNVDRAGPGRCRRTQPRSSAGGCPELADVTAGFG